MDPLPPAIAAQLRSGVARSDDLKLSGGRRVIEELIRAGVLVRRPGYIVVHRPSADRWTPVVEMQLRFPTAVASTRLAAWFHRAPPFDTPTPFHLDFASPGTCHPPSIRLIPDLVPDDVMVLAGLRVTTPARTLTDLGAVVGDDIVERVGEFMLHRRLTSEGALAATAARLGRRGRPGPAATERFLRRRRGAPACESDLEVRFLQRSRQLGFPEPTWRQLRVGRFRVDFAWRKGRGMVLVEVDGAGVHANPDALTADLRRQNALARTRGVLLRFTAEDIDRQPWRIEAELGFHLERPRARAQLCWGRRTGSSAAR